MNPNTPPTSAVPVSQHYNCTRCNIEWEGPITECPKCERTDRVIKAPDKPRAEPTSLTQAELADKIVREGLEWEWRHHVIQGDQWMKPDGSISPAFSVSKGAEIRIKPQPEVEKPAEKWDAEKAAYKEGKRIQLWSSDQQKWFDWTGIAEPWWNSFAKWQIHPDDLAPKTEQAWTEEKTVRQLESRRKWLLAKKLPCPSCKGIARIESYDGFPALWQCTDCGLHFSYEPGPKEIPLCPPEPLPTPAPQAGSAGETAFEDAWTRYVSDPLVGTSQLEVAKFFWRAANAQLHREIVGDAPESAHATAQPVEEMKKWGEALRQIQNILGCAEGDDLVKEVEQLVQGHLAAKVKVERGFSTVSTEDFEAAQIVLGRWLLEHPEVTELVQKKKIALGMAEVMYAGVKAESSQK